MVIGFDNQNVLEKEARVIADSVDSTGTVTVSSVLCFVPDGETTVVNSGISR